MNQVLKSALYASAVFALICIGLALLEVRKAATQLQASAKVATSAVTTLQKQASQTLTDANRLIVIAGAAASEAQKASAEERQYLKVLNGQVSNNLNQLSLTIAQARITMADIDKQTGEIATSATAALNAIPPIVASTNDTMKQATVTLTSASTLLSNPEIPKTLDNIQDATLNISHTTKAIDTRAQQMLKPASMARTILEKLLGWAAQVSQIIR